MRVLVTGSQGFIGKNLVVRLRELPGYEVVCFERGEGLAALAGKVALADAVVHLAGENRPKNEVDFEKGEQLGKDFLKHLGNNRFGALELCFLQIVADNGVKAKGSPE